MIKVMWLWEQSWNIKKKVFHSIYYARKTLDASQANYTLTEKEMLALFYAFEKFRSYLVGTKVVIYIDHASTCTCPTMKMKKPVDKMDFIIARVRH